MVALLIGTLDVFQVLAIPVSADDTADQKMVFGARACHGILEERCLVHVLVYGMAELEEQSILHVAREFLRHQLALLLNRQRQGFSVTVPS